MPPPPQTCPGGHVPQFIKPPQPFGTVPQFAFCCWHVFALHVGPPHWFGMPPPPHVLPSGHVPQLIVPPHPSPAMPQPMFCWVQFFAVHAGGMSCWMHAVRSNSMKMSAFC